MAPQKHFRFPSHLGVDGQEHTSWSDLFQRSPSSRDPSHSPTPLPSPSATKISRIDTLRTTLADIEDSLSIRTFQHNLTLTHGQYCQSCSRTAKPGTCGPTCALLCSSRSCVMQHWWTEEWHKACQADEALYHATIKAMDAVGYKAHSSQVKQWEDVVGKLHVACLNESERVERGNPRFRDIGVNVGGRIKQGWTFGGAWGEGRALGDGDVAPEDGGGLEGEEG